LQEDLQKTIYESDILSFVPTGLYSVVGAATTFPDTSYGFQGEGDGKK
jgi:hypothetical protein